MVEVPEDSEYLTDRTGKRTLATTDPLTNCVYMSEGIPDGMRTHVLTHELGHCAMVSYGLLSELARMAKPDQRVALEETICNIIADHGRYIIELSDGDRRRDILAAG